MLLNTYVRLNDDRSTTLAAVIANWITGCERFFFFQDMCDFEITQRLAHSGSTAGPRIQPFIFITTM